jgi:hypothetical protein
MTIHEMVNFLSTRLKEDMEMSAIFPFDTKTPKEDRRKPHMRDLALKPNVTFILSPEMHYFELGNENAERLTPHYHILEDAKIIRMPNKGTKKSKGSQRVIADKAKRDYGQFTYVASKTYGYQAIQEYRQNMTRNYDGTIKSKTQPREFSKRKKVSDINKRNYRYNKHYQYIERMLDPITRGLAIETDTKLKKGTYDSLGDSVFGTQEVAGYLDDNFELQSGFLPDFNWEGIE